MKDFDNLFEKVIWDELKTSNSSITEANDQNLYEINCIDNKLKFIDEYKRGISRKVNEIRTIEGSINYVQKIQFKFCEYVRLLKNLIDFDDHIEKDCDSKIYECFLDGADEILNYLEVYHTSLIAIGCPCSERTKFIETQEMNSLCKDLEEISLLVSKDRKMQKILTAIIDDCKDINKNSELTYYDLVYRKNLLAEFYDFKAKKASITPEMIENILIERNYNSPGFFKYAIEKIENEMEEGIEENKIEKLSFHYKLLNQTIYKTSLAYMANRPDIIQQISNWIKEEIKYYKHKIKYKVVLDNEMEDYIDGEKISLNLSVGQIACMLHIMVENGIIDSENKKNLFRMVSKFARSKKNDNISYKSLMNRYYNIDQKSWNSIMELLIEQYNYMRKLTP